LGKTLSYPSDGKANWLIHLAHLLTHLSFDLAILNLMVYPEDTPQHTCEQKLIHCNTAYSQQLLGKTKFPSTAVEKSDTTPGNAREL
jgi:hypothetical protein